MAESAGYHRGTIGSCANASFGLAALRPHFSALSSERASLMRPLEEAITAYFQERRQFIAPQSYRDGMKKETYSECMYW